ncbi:nuclease-related domain-containing protein [Halobacillus naozhouensis]|uniref:nuclease-related domain-containing protein n=1 Tax=Halobacillus naozhouensis TaxID=554880 RepID=UPI00362A8314
MEHLPPTHFKRIDVHEQYAIRSAGHLGETTTDHFLVPYLHSERYHIIQDIRLFDGIQHFQIDCLILNPSFVSSLKSKIYVENVLLTVKKIHFQIPTETNYPIRDGFNIYF